MKKDFLIIGDSSYQWDISGVDCMQNFKTLKLVAIQMICVFLKQNDGFIKIY
jgi:hypothetical protein